jgi:hypothetical protein
MIKATLALGAAVFGCSAAAAKPPTAFVQCDGYAKPKAGSDSLVKGKALTRSWGFAGLSSFSAFNPRGRQPGAAGVAACKAALADPLTAQTGWIRRVTLNQALALHHLEAREPEAALAALDSAAAAAGSNSADTFYRRSTGVSLDILRSIALMRLGRSEEGLAAVRRAAAARPWSARVQILALSMLGIEGGHEAEELALAERLRALDPDHAETMASFYLRSGRHAEAWALLKAQRDKEVPAAPAAAMFRFERDLGKGLVAAYAAARAGDGEGSRAVIESLRAGARAAAAQLGKMKLGLAGATDPAAVETAMMKPIDRWMPVIESAGLIAAGDAPAAQEKLIAGTDWPATTLLAQLTGDLRAKLPPEARKGMVAIEPAELRAKLDGDRSARLDRIASPELFSLLPEPEDEDKLNGFSGQWGLGLKPTGFKDKLLENGSTRIEFVGSVSSPLAVEEMTLLRAARLALEGGRKAFVIEKRDDFSRHSQMTMNGVPTGPQTLAGYMTRIEVRFVDDAAQPGAIDAAAVDSALAPLYTRSGRTG